jgi:hypothetical protein
VTPGHPVLRAITPDATADEVAAIVAAISAISAISAVTAAATTGAAAAEHDDRDQLDAWVRVSRLSSHRAGLQRGSWRLYGRIGRRARA